jgi:hypothetical protein
MDKRENKSWTKEEEVALLWYYQNGKSNAYMRKKLGRTLGGVSGRIGTLRAAETIDPVGGKVMWTPELNAYLTQLLEEGKSYEEIGSLLGRTPKAVDVQAYKLRKRGELIAAPDRRRISTPQGDLFIPVVTAEPVLTEPVREVPNTKVKSKPKPKPKPKPVVTAEPILMPKRQGWWSRLRHGDQALWLEVERLRAELNVLHASHTKLLSGLGEEE